MRIFISFQLVFGLFLMGAWIHVNSNTVSAAQEEEPSYAKWGQIAMKETKEKYPQSKIIDYLHVGREKAPEYTTEKFKLWLKNETKEFGVFVDIKFDNETEKVIDITFNETDR
ncbi:YqzG/YhdC family protein [Gracilibacillus salinarum]|uniref:YqzG/YhdC family protein n=1 Tax=Gracilibacillus salinarum TaxID=2932255 RepID=A0ABY4GL39_9BACI|nr:YqzG/YhdC family protein [Gracilibacillus salinarum]UOQ84931.1 YqzG/YhdC family protein [Gracilibacillus salinarum]